MKKYRNYLLLIETISIFFLNSFLAVQWYYLDKPSYLKVILYVPLLAFQGLWFYRFYIVGHEASHKKLFPKRLLINDLWGSIILLPLMVPITIFRKIHYFHHGFNRRDEHTSALDTFVLKQKPTFVQKIYYYILWYISVFFGGFFIHSLVSVLLFLFIPPKISQRISPAFNNWTWNDQFRSIALFLLGVGLHIGIYFFFGKTIYLYSLGYPLLSFAWVLSLLVYIFHYDTTIGHEVRYNVRSVRYVPIISWILMNFNEHATHHQYPNIPWYELPQKRTQLPAEFAEKNQQTQNFFVAIINQLKGPNLTYDNRDNS